MKKEKELQHPLAFLILLVPLTAFYSRRLDCSFICFDLVNDVSVVHVAALYLLDERIVVCITTE
jgi:hypothetical protein